MTGAGLVHDLVTRRVSMTSRRLLAALLLVLLPAISQAQTIEYYHLDAIGSVRVITDQTGAVIERHDYLPFGEECTTGPCAANPQAGGGDPRKFTGKERDTETGYDYFGARYLSVKTARFTTTDPAFTLAENLVDPQRWNRYVYVRNNPLRYVDPDGRDWLYQAVMWMTPMHRYAQQHDKPFLPAFFSGGFREVPRALPAWWNATRNEAATAAIIFGFMPGGPKDSGDTTWGSYRPSSPFPKGPHGEKVTSVSTPHTLLGTKVGSKVGPYTAAREFGENGEWLRDIHFTDHGTPNVPGHVNPHQHPSLPNPTGGTPRFGSAEPFVP